MSVSPTPFLLLAVSQIKDRWLQLRKRAQNGPDTLKILLVSRRSTLQPPVPALQMWIGGMPVSPASFFRSVPVLSLSVLESAGCKLEEGEGACVACAIWLQLWFCNAQSCILTAASGWLAECVCVACWRLHVAQPGFC